MASCSEGQMAFGATLSSIYYHARELDSGEDDMNVSYNVPSEAEWKKCPPLLCCWKKLLRLIDTTESLSTYAIEAVHTLSVGSLQFCLNGDR